jgi:hypothetical protein
MILLILIENFMEYLCFIISLLGIILNVFYLIDCEAEALSIAHFSLCTCIFLFRNCRVNDRNMWKQIITTELIITGKISNSGTRTPPREYKVC